MKAQPTLQILQRFNEAFVQYDGSLLDDLIAEDFVASDEHGIIRWRRRFGPRLSKSVRGVNVMRVRNGQIVEALGYAKSG